MWLHRFTQYLLRHRWQGLGLTLFITFIPVIGILGILVAALVTLRKGILEGAMYTVAATLPFFINFYVTGYHEATLPLMLWAAMSVAVLSNVLTWVFAVMLARHATWSQILQTAALLGVLAVSIVHLFYPTIADWWGVQLQSYYTEMTVAAPATTPAISDVQLELISATKQYATGMMVAAILFNAILQLVAVRWWQAIVFSPGILRRELHQIRLSKLTAVFFILSLVFWYLGNSVVLDLMPILYLLFGAAGLSLIHFLFGQMTSTTRWFWIWLLYIALIFALPTSLVVVSLMALIDSWIDIRRRWARV